jgi:hypothetical protein
MMRNTMSKIQLAELMPADAAAKAQALLALAAVKTGRLDWAEWLRRRCELLVDVNKLVVERPILKEVWSEPTEPAAIHPADDVQQAMQST